jgi:periplasmic divalent cation tolerance protein
MHGVILVAAESEAQAKIIALGLVESRLAACVAIAPIDSIYIWQGEINSAREWQLTIKTDLDLFVEIEAKIKDLHSYEVPEIIALPITKGSQAYLDWIDASVKSRG